MNHGIDSSAKNSFGWDSWRKIALALKVPSPGEQTAQACANACLLQPCAKLAAGSISVRRGGIRGNTSAHCCDLVPGNRPGLVGAHCGAVLSGVGTRDESCRSRAARTA